MSKNQLPAFNDNFNKKKEEKGIISKKKREMTLGKMPTYIYSNTHIIRTIEGECSRTNGKRIFIKENEPKAKKQLYSLFPAFDHIYIVILVHNPLILGKILIWKNEAMTGTNIAYKDEEDNISGLDKKKEERKKFISRSKIFSNLSCINVFIIIPLQIFLPLISIFTLL